MRTLLLLTFMLFFILPGKAQRNGDWCGMNTVFQNQLASEPGAQQSFLEYRQAIGNYVRNYEAPESNDARIVPVVIHIIHDNGSGDISDEQVLDGMRIMNEDFRRLNADTTQTSPIFQFIADDAHLEFRLATKDPQGNCTNGIVRVNSPLANSAGDNVKALSYWPSNQYMNIWLVNTIGGGGGGGIILGYAQFPGFGAWNTYGVVNRSDYWGSIGTAQDVGRTPTHEIGHCFGLFHTFETFLNPGGNPCGLNCEFDGDEVCDTPPTPFSTQGCDRSQNLCSNDSIGGSTMNPNPFNGDVVDQIENYMSYDACQNMFSRGQANRMNAVIDSFPQLTNLVSQANLIATGTDSASYATFANCAPIVEFTVDKELICEGQDVAFRDFSYNSFKDSTWVYSWSFPGGNPSTSNLEIPRVTYATSGIYNATLTITSTSGSSAPLTKTGIVEVREGSGTFIAPYVESITTSEFPNNFFDPTLAWDVYGNRGRGWERTTNAFFTTPASVFLDNYLLSGPVQSIQNLESPIMDLTGLSNAAYLHFKLSYRTRNNAFEALRIYISTDCGDTWRQEKIYVGPLLATGPSFDSGPYQPTSSSDWRAEVIDVSRFAGQDNILFRFEFTANGGNNIFLDDIEISGNPNSVVGLEGGLSTSKSLTLYPNPSSGVYHSALLENEQALNGKIITGSGQTFELNFNHLSSGKIDVRSLNLPAGVYQVLIQTERSLYNSRIILNVD